MTETAKRRRRWPWIVLAGVLILIAGALAWPFRPLNPTEQQLVGRWLYGSEVHIQFDANRRYHVPMFTTKSGISELTFQERGNWTASDGQVTLFYDALDENLPWRVRASNFVRDVIRPPHAVIPLRVNSPHVIQFGECEVVRARPFER